jgi:anti-sigma regulatory factor (Ser/Thr protein kinase)
VSTWLVERTARHGASAEPRGIRQVRHEARKTIEGCGLKELADAAELAASELLTNALLYGRIETLTLELTLEEPWLSLSVRDCNPTPPYPCGIDEQAEGGRGLLLTAGLADAWGFRATAAGKRVFAEFLTHSAPGEDHTTQTP